MRFEILFGYQFGVFYFQETISACCSATLKEDNYFIILEKQTMGLSAPKNLAAYVYVGDVR